MLRQTIRKHYLLTALLAAAMFTACGGGDDPDTPPTPIDPQPEEKLTGTVSITQEGGEATPDNPAKASEGKPATITLRQKSTYEDPDGTTYTCEPKASITMTVSGDTVRAHSLADLLALATTADTHTTTGSNPTVVSSRQQYGVGTVGVTFDLQHEVYTHRNSRGTNIEMPYLRLQPAKMGKANSEAQTRAAQQGLGVTATAVRLTPLPRTRGSVTTEQAYHVEVSFTVDAETVHETSASRKTFSLQADYTGIVETTTEYPDPTLTFDYSVNPQSGTTSTRSPYVLGKGQSEMLIDFHQTAQYSHFDLQKMETLVTTFEPKASMLLKAQTKDTIWVSDVSELHQTTKHDPTTGSTGENPADNTGSQVFTIGGQDVALSWAYQSYQKVKIGGEDVSLPYLSLSAPEMTEVKVTAVPDGVLIGKKGKLFTVSVTFSQTLSAANVSEPQSQQLQYVVNYIGAIAEEEPKPAAELVDIKYRKGYQWYEPHDNIPITYQYIVYKDSIFSDGTVHTSESRSGLTTMEWELSNASAHGKYNQTIEEVRSGNGSKVKVYYFARQTDFYDAAYRSIKSSRKVAVPDLSTVTYKEETPEIRNPDQWDSYPGWNPSAPKVGWYWADFYYKNMVSVYYSEEKGEFLTVFDICSRWYNKILYVEDSINGGKLITFLGDESDIDDIDYRPKFDFDISEKSTTMPTGEPAKVFTHTCTTTFLGRQFHYELVDTVYQYSTPPFEGEVTN